MEATGFEAIPGFGVSAKVDGRLVQAGADRYMERLGITVASLADESERLAADG